VASRNIGRPFQRAESPPPPRYPMQCATTVLGAAMLAAPRHSRLSPGALRTWAEHVPRGRTLAPKARMEQAAGPATLAPCTTSAPAVRRGVEALENPTAICVDGSPERKPPGGPSEPDKDVVAGTALPRAVRRPAVPRMRDPGRQRAATSMPRHRRNWPKVCSRRHAAGVPRIRTAVDRHVRGERARNARL
jgi:hypothetical protein